MLGFSLIPIETFLEAFLAILFISFTSLSDSTLINSTFFRIAITISSSVFPTPEKTILLLLIPALIAFNNSPIETTSAPDPIFFNSLSNAKFELDFTEKHINGFVFSKFFLKLFIF